MKNVTIKKGLDLRIKGALDPGAITPAAAPSPRAVAIFPDDFPGFTPKACVKEGDCVAAGQPLMLDKNHPEIALVSPVDGKVSAIVRGERRKLLHIEVTPSPTDAPAPTFDLDGAATPDELKTMLQNAGWWALMRQRPYDIVPDPAAAPRDIFVTTFDSAPLAPTIDTLLASDAPTLQKGIDTLKRLTRGAIHLGVRPDADTSRLKGVDVTAYKGPHPAGNVGVQIAAVKPINKGETVWTLDITALWRLGRLAATGKMDFSAEVAVTGPEVAHPKMVATVVGADMKSILGEADIATTHSVRVISGNVLTGNRLGTDDAFLHYPYRQVTVIREGDDIDEFMGWASNSLDKMSESRSFLSHFLRGKLFSPDARIHGGRRAMIMSGVYDKVVPMDILPEFLVKAILSRDIDRMEALGIYEVAPEDFALAEYVDPSKLELQKIVREGLDYLRKELN